MSKHDALNEALQRYAHGNKVRYQPGTSRDDLNDQLRRAGRGENLPLDPPAETEPERAQGGSADGGAGIDAAVEPDPHAAINAVLRRAAGGW